MKLIRVVDALIGRVVSVVDGIARAKNLVHSVFFLIPVFFNSNTLYRFFSSLPFVKNMPKRVQILLFIIAKLISVLVLSRVALSFGYILMEDLHRAVAQFYPSTSGGMNLGSSGQPPLPSDTFIPVSQDPEDNPPEGSLPLVHQQQDQTSAPQVTAVGQQKLESVLLKHINRHCRLVEVRNKYPQLNSTEVDYLYLAKNLAISQFDTDTKTDSEMADLAAHIGNYRKIKILLDHFLEEYFKED